MAKIKSTLEEKDIERSEMLESKLVTWKELEDRYYATHECNSDDVDAEEAKIERWADEQGFEVIE